jgi:hypothetical protein
MTDVYEIPLRPKNQIVSTTINDHALTLKLTWLDSDKPCWILDIVGLVCGIPLLTGQDLLAQYDYLGLNFIMFCGVDGDQSADPTFETLGITSHLWVEF